MRLGFIVIFQFLFLSFSGADIVFLDFNDGPKEIAAARKAARRCGEKVIVFPSVPKKVKQEMDRIVQRQRRLGRDHGNEQDPQERRRIAREYRSLGDQRVKLSKDYRANGESVARFFKDLADKGTDVSSLIISGHDGNGDFFGSLGQMHTSGLKRILKQHPKLAGKIKSMILAGCYTTKPGTLDFEWKGVLPNVQMIAGYEKTAPLNSRPAGHEYIRRALEGEKKLISLKKPKQIKRKIRSLIPGHLGEHASICLPDGKYGTRSKFIDMKKAWEACSDNIKKAKEMRKDYECFLEAETEECATPPQNTHVNNPLRDFYNVIQDLEPCYHNEAFRSELSRLNIPSGEKIIRLIYYKNIRKHFKKKFAKPLKESKDPLKKAGLSEEHLKQLDNIDKLKRSEAKKLISAITKLWYERKHQLGEDQSQRDKDLGALAANYIGNGMRKYLLELQPDCIPFSWVEDTTSDQPQCRVSMGKKALTLAERRIEDRVFDRKYRIARDKKRKADHAMYKAEDAAIGKDPVSREQEKVIETKLKRIEASNNKRVIVLEYEINRNQRVLEGYNNALKKDNLNELDRDFYKKEVSRIERKIQDQQRELEQLKDYKAPNEELKKNNPKKYYQHFVQQVDKWIKGRQVNAQAQIRFQQEEARRLKKKIQEAKGDRKMNYMGHDIEVQRYIDEIKQRNQDLADQKKYYHLMGEFYGKKDPQARKEIIRLIKKRSKEQYNRKLKAYDHRINALRAKQRIYCKLNEVGCNMRHTVEIKKIQNERKKLREANEMY